jgi:hypothetical protein
MGDDSTDTVILNIGMRYLVTLAGPGPSLKGGLKGMSVVLHP